MKWLVCIWHSKRGIFLYCRWFESSNMPSLVFSLYHPSFLSNLYQIATTMRWTNKKIGPFLFSRELRSQNKKKSCCRCGCFAFNWRRRVFFHFITSIIWRLISFACTHTKRKEWHQRVFCYQLNNFIQCVEFIFFFHFMWWTLSDELCPMLSCSTIIKHTPHSRHDWLFFGFITTRSNNRFYVKDSKRGLIEIRMFLLPFYHILSIAICFCRVASFDSIFIIEWIMKMTDLLSGSDWVEWWDSTD